MRYYIKKINKYFRYNRKRTIGALFLFLVILGIGLGYSFLNAELGINGVVNASKATWDIHFENIQVKSGSVTPTTEPTISNNISVGFAATLENPGDFYEFNVDIVNDGTIDAMIDSIQLTPVLTTNQKKYFDYGVIYSDGIELDEKQLLEAGKTETIKVYFKYLENADASNYPTSDTDFSCNVTINYVQADNTAVSVAPEPNNFSTDSWATIIRAVKSNNISKYNVGDTKTVNMGTLGTYTLRIANTTTPAECSTTGFSQTACGFVLEFADIITTRSMNSTDTNVGGWPASEMREYVNSDIYNALPTELKNGICDTTAVSGHGPTSGETNFTSTDKLYLLDAKEIYGESFTSSYNTAKDSERQLDYYSNLGVTTDNYSGAIKRYSGSNFPWWLRSAVSNNNRNFYGVDNDGYWDRNGAHNTDGVSPAFRIG